MKDEYDIDINNGEEFQQTGVAKPLFHAVNGSARDKMIKSGLAKNITPYIDSNRNVFLMIRNTTGQRITMDHSGYQRKELR